MAREALPLAPPAQPPTLRQELRTALEASAQRSGISIADFAARSANAVAAAQGQGTEEECKAALAAEPYCRHVATPASDLFVVTRSTALPLLPLNLFCRLMLDQFLRGTAEGSRLATAVSKLPSDTEMNTLLCSPAPRFMAGVTSSYHTLQRVLRALQPADPDEDLSIEVWGGQGPRCCPRAMGKAQVRPGLEALVR